MDRSDLGLQQIIARFFQHEQQGNNARNDGTKNNRNRNEESAKPLQQPEQTSQLYNRHPRLKALQPYALALEEIFHLIPDVMPIIAEFVYGEYEVGQYIDALDDWHKWYPAHVLDINYNTLTVLIRYDMWSTKYDEWLSLVSNRIAKVGEHTFGNHFLCENCYKARVPIPIRLPLYCRFCSQPLLRRVEHIQQIPVACNAYIYPAMPIEIVEPSSSSRAPYNLRAHLLQDANHKTGMDRSSSSESKCCNNNNNNNNNKEREEEEEEERQQRGKMYYFPQNTVVFCALCDVHRKFKESLPQHQPTTNSTIITCSSGFREG